MPVLVDTNVILDVVTNDPLWSSWSTDQLSAFDHLGLIINPIVFAEFCYHRSTVESVERLVTGMGLTIEAVPNEGLFRAAKAFRAYRSRGGQKNSVLPDFFIGGHAEAAGLTLLTRDVQRYGTYFPTVQLVAPSP